ncbi:hypothetical protein L0156_11865 [bacterium]|nr:hypothetical protein [bacterium]
MKSKQRQMCKTIWVLACVAFLCPRLFSEAENEIKIVAEIAEICNSSGDSGVWVHSGNRSPVKGRQYMGLSKGDRVLVDEKSRAVVLLRYGLPTEPPLLVSRICEKNALVCGPESTYARKMEQHCLTSQVPYYEVKEPAADTPFLKKVAQLFTDVFHHIGKTEYDFSVTPYSDHRPKEKQSLPFSPVAPSGCAVLNNHPVFYWTGPEGQAYKVEVFEKQSAKKLWSSDAIKQLTLAYSGDPLRPGEYTWHLVSNKQESEAATFEILNEEDRAPARELLESFEDPVFKTYTRDQLALLKASALVDQRFYADALPLLLSLNRTDSHHPAVPALLRVVYEKQGRPDLSRKEQ